MILTLDILIFSFTLWLGTYLLGRDFANPRLALAGGGLVSFAFTWGCAILGRYNNLTPWSEFFARAGLIAQFFPAIGWTGAMLFLLPEEFNRRNGLIAVWKVSAGLLGSLIVLGGAATDLFWASNGTITALKPGYIVIAWLAFMPLLAVLGLHWSVRQRWSARHFNGLLAVVTLFFAFSTALLFAPLDLLPREWLLLGVGLDLVLLGAAVAVADAFSLGEAWLPDFWRSIVYAGGYAFLFGTQIALVIFITTGPTVPLLLLLMTTVTVAIITQTFTRQFRSLLDRAAFSRLPRLRQERAELRAVEEALPRHNSAPAPDLESMADDDFARLTRRAISSYGDLARLSASPLTYLPQISSRLAVRMAEDSLLERTAELKALLTQSILRLKPRHQGEFGTTDEWRHYNALYFPYVLGLKPYSRRHYSEPLKYEDKVVLDWFRDQVPERTLYNWQNSATRLVAQNLRVGWQASELPLKK